MIEIQAFDHIGIRVTDSERALAFYRLFGFEEAYRAETDPVIVLRNAAQVELNLIVNGVSHETPNVLMDAPLKYPGYTHMALRVTSIEQTVSRLSAAGVTITEGPLRLGDGIALFVRDPDGNVIELRNPEP